MNRKKGEYIKCKYEGCELNVYAREYCKKHYARIITFGGYKPKRIYDVLCSVVGCGKPELTKGFCGKHYARSKKGSPMMDTEHLNIGVRNGNWNGGISEYPNHYTMKQIRKKILIERGEICSECGVYGNEIHHIDKSKNIHTENNLKVLCHKCHTKLHSGRKNKHSQKYLDKIKSNGNITVAECDALAKKINISTIRVYTALSGKRPVSLKLAIKIERGSEGKFKIIDLIPELKDFL